MFLSANNFFWRVERRADRMDLIAMWRELGRPKQRSSASSTSRTEATCAARTSSATSGERRGSSTARGPQRLQLRDVRIEIDRKTAASPRGTHVIAELRNGQGAGLSAQMTYYTRGGAKVFAAAAFTLGGSATRTYGASCSTTCGAT